jgi:RND family efflux transporter MFP subunit
MPAMQSARPLMRRVLALIPLVLLAACGADDAPEQATADVARPVRLFTVERVSGERLRRFPARVQASRQAELAFRVGGQIEEILVLEGDLVSEGQLIARLDDSDLATVVADREATYDNAERNFRRGKELLATGTISQLEYDQMEANFRSAEAALEQARNNLQYTELRAPFAGLLAERRIEKFEEVQPRQGVFFLQNVRELEVVIDLPESVIRAIRGNETLDDQDVREGRANDVRAWATFDDHPEAELPLRITEIATRADSATRTYRVTFAMSAPQTFTVLPGMSAEVSVDFSMLIAGGPSVWVPATAVHADEGLAPRVWVFDRQSRSVSPRPVEVGRVADDRIEILDGLEGGEGIVAVGAAYLAPGMEVAPMPQREQAVPRAGDR